MTAVTKKYHEQVCKIMGIVLMGASLSLPVSGSAGEIGHNHRILHQRIKNHFDKNGDGMLTGREAIKARSFHARWHNLHNRPVVRPLRRPAALTGAN